MNDDDYNILSNISQSDMDDEDFEDATEATQNMLGSLAEKNFSANKPTARLHEFDYSDVAGDDEHQAKSLLTKLKDGDNFESGLNDLAEQYLKTANSEPGILIAVQFSHKGHELVAIIKAPYEDVYEPDDEVGLSQISEIIEDELKKGVIYPRVNYSLDEARPEETGVYQKNYYAQHWWKFLGLKDTKTNNEVLNEWIVEDIEEGDDENPLSEAQSVDDFDEIKRDLDDEKLDGQVTITISGIDIRVRLRDVLERNIFLVNDGSYYVVIPGNEPNVAVTGHNGGEYRKEILDNLSEYNSFDDIQ
ncbi:hypothetical protein GCM10009067_39530 [Haloarcula sebkhae]|nr:hypothetical protein GCM10009067_39530 [Haloarcula sebkhae]